MTESDDTSEGSSGTTSDATTSDATTSDPATPTSSEHTGDSSGESDATGDPMPSACGNAVLDPGEECDDGNLLDRDGCNNVCERSVCGLLWMLTIEPVELPHAWAGGIAVAASGDIWIAVNEFDGSSRFGTPRLVELAADGSMVGSLSLDGANVIASGIATHPSGKLAVALASDAFEPANELAQVDADALTVDWQMTLDGGDGIKDTHANGDQWVTAGPMFEQAQLAGAAVHRFDMATGILLTTTRWEQPGALVGSTTIDPDGSLHAFIREGQEFLRVLTFPEDGSDPVEELVFPEHGQPAAIALGPEQNWLLLVGLYDAMFALTGHELRSFDVSSHALQWTVEGASVGLTETAALHLQGAFATPGGSVLVGEQEAERVGSNLWELFVAHLGPGGALTCHIAQAGHQPEDVPLELHFEAAAVTADGDVVIAGRHSVSDVHGQLWVGRFAAP